MAIYLIIRFTMSKSIQHSTTNMTTENSSNDTLMNNISSVYTKLPDSRKYYFLSPTTLDNDTNSDGYYEERF